MQALLKEADRLGVRVLHGQLGDRNGVYYHQLNLIVLDLCLNSDVERFTLAHELGHAHHQHISSTPFAEMQADDYAAHLLVEREEYRRAELISDSPAYIARELGLSLRVIEAYGRNLARR